MRRILLLSASHIAALAVGFAVGIYTLPILTAPPGPDAATLAAMAASATWQGDFRRDLPGSDPLHWGEGRVSVSASAISHAGRLAPGPDYKLYLVPEFVDTGAAFLAVKDRALRIADIKTFDGFVAEVPAGVDLEAHTTVLVWCERFSQFITAAQYR
jgi:hypothetical protein